MKLQKKKYKDFTIFYIKEDIKYVESVKKTIDIIEALNDEMFKFVKAIENIFILKTIKFDSSLSYKDIKAIVLSVDLIRKESLIWLAGSLVHEAAHIRQPKTKDNDYYWCEMNATKAEQKLYKLLNDKTLLNYVDPKIGRKEYFDNLKKNQKEGKDNKSKDNVYDQFTDAEGEIDKITEIVYKALSKD